MQTLGIIGMENVSITMHNSTEDQLIIRASATNEHGVLNVAKAKRIEFARNKKRLADQGATEVKFFPV